MSEDLRAVIDRALQARTVNGKDRSVYLSDDEIDTMIAAATPLIEAALIERLRKRALASDGSRQAGPGEYWLTGREQAKVLLALFDADDPASDARPGGEEGER